MTQLLWPLLNILYVASPFLLIAAVVAAITAARRHDADEPEQEPGIGTVRRLFLYGFGLAGLALAASGASALLGGALDVLGGDTIIAENRRELAFGLSLTIVGAPAWAIFWLLAQRSLRDHAVEQRSLARRSYFGLVRAIALLLVIINAVAIGRSLLRVEPFDGSPWGLVLVWGGVWLFHTRAAAVERAPTAAAQLIDRLYLYFGALAGLATLVSGAVGALNQALNSSYEALFLTRIVGEPGGPWTDAGRTAIAVAAVAAAIWWWHWLRVARGDSASTLWRVYLFLFGILGGLAAVVTASAVGLHAALRWIFGVPEALSAAEHFDLLPATASALAVGAAAWGYHRAVLRERPPAAREPRSGVERVYRYLVAAAGVATLSAGLVTLVAVAVAVDAVAGDARGVIRSAGWWRNQLALAVTLLAVGTPLWARYWFELQRRAAEAGGRERSALSRRVYLLGIVGAAVLVALVNLTILLFRLLEATLDGDLSRQTVQDSRWPIALLLAAVAAGVYHWLVFREDQRFAREAELPPAPAGPGEIVLLVAGASEPLARALEQQLGARVRVWQRLDQQAPATLLSDEQIERLLAQIRAISGERVAVICDANGEIAIVPYAVRN